ncbi:uncharacterized protein N7482_004509 [Penicillium canariense]|uniref:Uncharacterized protein n=1 Tax=Penicillium canariense TaxID=189055 RepID=A0A9W9I6R6_9EURO|nr:uncharacterized protein N7482_004509 [Penicillium canariense]KAJ5168915.1 hypothetical protein N7482_004509 [Penicillium canariense]
MNEGKLEYHLPPKYNRDRLEYIFTTAHHATTMASQQAYIGNATIPAVTVTVTDFQAHKLQGTPQRNRIQSSPHTSEQRVAKQVFAMSPLRKKTLNETGDLPLTGAACQVSITCTNWQRAWFFELDFSAARADIAQAGPTPLGSHVARNLVTVTGRDGVGSWWVQILTWEGAWVRIKEIVRDEFEGIKLL